MLMNKRFYSYAVTTLAFLIHSMPILSAAQDYVRCGSGSNSLCRAAYPICCNGFCASAGEKCCTNDQTCDPGQECCTAYDEFDNPEPTCCDIGTYCGSRGCVPDVCASITDPGVCVSQYNATMNQTSENSLCSWCCESQVCVPSAKAYAVCGTSISSPWATCADPCALYSTCDECTLANACLWDSGSQRCFVHGNSQQYNPYAVVSHPDGCSAVMYWGTGINPTNGQFDFLGSSKIVMIVFAVLFITCLLAICISGARVAMLVNRTHQDWEEERDQHAQTVSAAVPRYGFAEAADEEEEEGSNNGKNKKKSKKAQKKAREKNFRTPLLSRMDSNASKAGADGTAVGLDDTVCHVCHNAMQHDSRRRFVTDGKDTASTTAASSQIREAAKDAGSAQQTPNSPSDGAKNTIADTWHQVVLLPCYHRVCKNCILQRAEANAHSLNQSTASRLLTNIKSRLFFSQASTPVTGNNNDRSQTSGATRGSGGGHSLVAIRAEESAEAGSLNKDARESASETEAPLLSKKKEAVPPRSIRSILDTPDVAENMLIDVLAGRSVADSSSSQAQSSVTSGIASARPNSVLAAMAGNHHTDEATTVSDATAKKVQPAHCPVCQCEVELVFVPGKVLR